MIFAERNYDHVLANLVKAPQPEDMVLYFQRVLKGREDKKKKDRKAKERTEKERK